MKEKCNLKRGYVTCIKVAVTREAMAWMGHELSYLPLSPYAQTILKSTIYILMLFLKRHETTLY